MWGVSMKERVWQVGCSFKPVEVEGIGYGVWGMRYRIWGMVYGVWGMGYGGVWVWGYGLGGDMTPPSYRS
ncbi:hypothetical protein M0802_009710 [Mischocyttarus mexicanus]|nr:hypothetical protein M0802_009710 [Mischocyttarus mexicanus]